MRSGITALLPLNPEKGGKDQRGPAEADVKIAIAELEREMESPELVDQINLNINVVPSTEALIASREKVIINR